MDFKRRNENKWKIMIFFMIVIVGIILLLVFILKKPLETNTKTNKNYEEREVKNTMNYVKNEKDLISDSISNIINNTNYENKNSVITNKNEENIVTFENSPQENIIENVIVSEKETESNFLLDRVVVTTTIERKELKKEYTLDEFAEIELTKIVNNNYGLKDVGDSLTLYLKEQSEDNVLYAVEKLKNNPIVSYVSPEWITTIE